MAFGVPVIGVEAMADDSRGAREAPPDQPVSVRSRKDGEAVDEAAKPYVEEAGRTYPGAKARFLAGLLRRYPFYAAARLTDSGGSVEQVFIEVEGIADGFIKGKIRSSIVAVEGYEYGNEYRFPERELQDRLILHPDGTEEENAEPADAFLRPGLLRLDSAWHPA